MDTKIFNNGHPRVIPPQTIGHGGVRAPWSRSTTPVTACRPATALTISRPPFSAASAKCARRESTTSAEDIHAISWDYAGTFAEYVAIPKAALNLGNLVKAPVNLKDEQVALAEPLACVINGQEFFCISCLAKLCS